MSQAALLKFNLNGFDKFRFGSKRKAKSAFVFRLKSSFTVNGFQHEVETVGMGNRAIAGLANQTQDVVWTICPATGETEFTVHFRELDLFMED